MNLESLIPQDFSGVISVRKNNETLLQKACGWADRANKIPNETDTKFATASAGKAFVAVGILQLIEQGKLRFDDSIGEILDFDLHKIDKKITIGQLLNHTSGIPDYFDESVMDEYEELWHDFPNYRIRNSADLLPLFINKPMMYKAGEKFQYNNSGYVMLGLVIEKLTGFLFDEYLRKNVFETAGMVHTGYYELDRLPPKYANSYIYDEDKKEFYTNIYSVDVKGTGAGGAFTTVADVEQFWSALLGGELLSKPMADHMLSLQSSAGNDYYGYGMWLEKSGAGTFEPWFQGSDPGVSFISCYDRAKNENITIISNTGDRVGELSGRIKGGLVILRRM
jgi:CubicO group peptidase (beta-lactamase class C family)